MTDERTARIAAAARDLGVDWVALTSPDAVCYATGHVEPIEWGPSPFAGGPTTAFVGRSGDVGLVAPNHDLAAPPAGVDAEPYVGFAYREHADLVANYAAAVRALAGRLGVKGGVAVEPASFTHLLGELLAADRTHDVGSALREARATKTATEIAALRRSADAAALGQMAARRAARPGRSELGAFADIRSAIEHAAGARCPLAGDFVSGVARTAGGGGSPIGRILAPGDPVICDLAPRVQGYWGDSCGAFTLGPPERRWLDLFDRAKQALALAVSEMRPGLPIAALDAMLRRVVEVDGVTCHHHMGHSIGTSVHEWPRILPVEGALLREDMVMMVEPGGYQPEIGGVRLEWMIHVTATGAAPLAPFGHDPEVEITE